MASQHDKKDLEMATMFAPIISQYIQIGTAAIIFILGWVSLSLELCIRRDFGERYLSLIRLILAMTFIGTFRLLLILIFGFGIGFTVFGYAYVIMFFYHRWQIRQRNKRGEEWHSMSFGVSRFQPLIDYLRSTEIPLLSKLDDWFLYRFVEPGLFFVIGFITFYIEDGFGAYLIIASLALFIKNQMTYSKEYNQYLDTVDARIEAKYLENALTGTQKQHTAGISIVTMPENLSKLLASPSEDEIESKVPSFAATVQETLGGDEQDFAIS